MTYQDYLSQQKYSKNTIKVHQLRIQRFKAWLQKKRTTAIQLNYSQLLQYANYLQTTKQYQRQTTNNELRAVKLYYDYLIAKSAIEDNPAEGLTIRGKNIKVITATLTADELEDLYYSYETQHHDTYFKATKHRDKVLLGLILFQGITSTELHNLQDNHLQIDKGSIYIPSTRRSNSRTLKLQPCQIADIITYKNTIRPHLAQRIKIHNHQQFIHGNITRLYNITNRIIKSLKQYNNKAKSQSQLRTSLIINWLKTNNLRKVQYMAGHRYISSTEKYVQDDLENLHDIVNNFHPIS